MNIKLQYMMLRAACGLAVAIVFLISTTVQTQRRTRTFGAQRRRARRLFRLAARRRLHPWSGKIGFAGAGIEAGGDASRRHGEVSAPSCFWYIHSPADLHKHYANKM